MRKIIKIILGDEVMAPRRARPETLLDDNPKENTMDIQDDTEALRDLFNDINPGMSDVESLHQAELDPQHALALMANPKAALKAMGIPVSDASQVQVSMKNRANRAMLEVAQKAAQLRRIIIIVIHYRNCDADIIIIGMN
jgi:hypothetical protein